MVKKYKPDAFDPLTNTIYEFYGDYWHGNPYVYNQELTNKHNKIKFGELYKKMIEKEQALKNAGYKIISIWESDFNKCRKIIKRERK